jgi:hypothetical protein
MKAFQSIRAEMREAIIATTHPGNPVTAARPMQRQQETPDEEDGYIEPWMEIAFRALTHASQTGEPFALVSCFMNGQPAVVIAATRDEGERTHILPLFVACQPGMLIRPHPEDVDDAT